MCPVVCERDLSARAARVIGDGYRGPLTLTTVARALGCSPRTLQRAYTRRHTSFTEELTRVRLCAAAELLATQALSVEVIARLVGFSGAGALADAFGRRYGLRPGEFRAAARMSRRATLADPARRRRS